ncbi:MAG: acyltransferase [Bacteroidales bacterium]|nr:acyltransferase [Bacteroidales bacterium]
MMSSYIESKPRYEILDGLRGVAALMVVAYHLCEVYMTSYADAMVNHGYLAVDFFFALSGFVIGYAYDDRWDRMSTWSFFKRRLTRLHPMVIFGVLIGVICFYFQDCADFPLVKDTGAGQLLIVMLINMLMLPLLPCMDIRGTGEVSALNGPTWTLMYEYLANIIYAFILRKLPKIAIAILMIMAAFLTLDVAMDMNIFGMLDGYETPNAILGGWSLTGQGVYLGFTRLAYPFLAGLLISRMGWTVSVKNAFLWCSLAIVVLFNVPFLGGYDMMAEGLFNSVMILLVMPLIVSVAAGSRISGKKMSSLCRFCGEISFPLYITHYPFVFIQHAWAQNHPELPTSIHVIVAIGTFMIALFVSYAALRLYDEPVRKWLKKNWC